MPRAPSENRIKAEKLYEDGKALIEIAEMLGISEGTVRSWKSRDKWVKKGSKTSQKKTVVALQTGEAKKTATLQKKKKGAPIGNKNSLGKKNAKGNKGNPNPVPPPLLHGGYSKIYWDTLDDEEKAMVEDIHSSEEMIYLDQLKLYTVRERRLLKAINKYRAIEDKNPNIGGLYISSVKTTEHKRRFADDAEKEAYDEIVAEKIEKGERMPGESYTVTTETQATIDLIARLERELTYVQGNKTKATDALAKLHLEQQKMDSLSSGSGVVDDWVKAILGDEDLEDEDEEESEEEDNESE